MEEQGYVLDMHLGGVDAVADDVPDDEHHEIRREIIRAMVVELLTAGGAGWLDLKKTPEEAALATGGTAAEETALDGGRDVGSSRKFGRVHVSACGHLSSCLRASRPAAW